MKLLAIETSANACSVTLMLDGVLHSTHQIAPMQQAKLILPLIKATLEQHNIILNQLDALAFGCGPGSFTGVRIATSVMQGLAYASEVPLISVSSLAALAQNAYTDLGWRQLAVAVDARIQEVYAGFYKINANGIAERVGEEQVCPPHTLVAPDQREWHGVGNGWEVYAAELKYKPAILDTTRMPTAAGVALLAEDKFKRQEFVSPDQAIPVYLRDNVAMKSS
jgi:tRNA threonylcarbamoyladenosine biosynthesis protein TsaB